MVINKKFQFKTKKSKSVIILKIGKNISEKETRKEEKEIKQGSY
jgi:hypothetical protein